MFLLQLFRNRRVHLLTFIAVYLAIMLIIMVNTICMNIRISLLKQIEQMNLSTQYLQGIDSISNDVLEKIRYESNCLIICRTEYYDNYKVCGIDENLENLFSLKYEGRLLNRSDYIFNNNVCVLGNNTKNFFENKTIGDLIYINGLPFEIVGIIDKNNSDIIMDFNSSIFIPLDYVENDASECIYFASEQDFDSFGIIDNNMLYINQNETKDAFVELINFLENILMFLSYFSLAIALIGIVNSSISNLKNKIKEIGLKRTLGASKRRIFVELLLENVIIILLALILSFFISFILLKIINKSIVFSLHSLWKNIMVVIISAIISGLISAIKASKISLNEALNQ